MRAAAVSDEKGGPHPLWGRVLRRPHAPSEHGPPPPLAATLRAEVAHLSPTPKIIRKPPCPRREETDLIRHSPVKPFGPKLLIRITNSTQGCRSGGSQPLTALPKAVGTARMRGHLRGQQCPTGQVGAPRQARACPTPQHGPRVTSGLFSLLTSQWGNSCRGARAGLQPEELGHCGGRRQKGEQASPLPAKLTGQPFFGGPARC